MPAHPPSPTARPRLPLESTDRLLVQTTPLAETLESEFGCRVDTDTLESLLLELDRLGYLELVTVTTAGEYVWDLTDSADRIAADIAAIVTDILKTRLEN